MDLMIEQENLQESTPDPADTVEPVLSGRPRGMAKCPLNRRIFADVIVYIFAH